MTRREAERLESAFAEQLATFLSRCPTGLVWGSCPLCERAAWHVVTGEDLEPEEFGWAPNDPTGTEPEKERPSA